MHINSSMYTIMGWVGTLAYLLAYFLLSINKISSKSLLYHSLNVIGAIGLTANALHLADVPNVVVNCAWGLIAISALVVFSRKKQN